MGNMSISLANDSKFHNTGILLGILVFIRTMPCYLWSLENTLRPLCTIFILGICIMNRSKEKWTWLIFASIAFAYIWATVFVDHTGAITVFNFLAFAFIPILKRELIFETYNTFYKIMVFVLALSIVNYILYLLGLGFGGITIAPLNTLREHTYTMYPFLVVPSEGSPRFFAIFDEPGVVGTICAMILVAENMNLKKNKNLVVLIAGVLSFSMFFYVALAISVVLFSNNNKRRFQYALAAIIFIFLTYNNTVVYDAIWSRFEFDASTGTFAGDNRSRGSVGDYFDSIIGTPIFFTGLGSDFVEQFKGEASLKLLTLKYGFIFVFFNILGYAVLSFREIANRKEWVYFMLFFLCTIYQRPGFIDTASIFLFTMVINSYGYKKNINVIKSVKNDSLYSKNIGISHLV